MVGECLRNLTGGFLWKTCMCPGSSLMLQSWVNPQPICVVLVDHLDHMKLNGDKWAGQCLFMNSVRRRRASPRDGENLDNLLGSLLVLFCCCCFSFQVYLWLPTGCFLATGIAQFRGSCLLSTEALLLRLPTFDSTLLFSQQSHNVCRKTLNFKYSDIMRLGFGYI